MFKYPFLFEGRIRRLEYTISFIMYIIMAYLVNDLVMTNPDSLVMISFYIPIVWFLWAQGAKRSHDIGKSGWWQLVPFYGLWLLFEDGDPNENEYGESPKNIAPTESID